MKQEIKTKLGIKTDFMIERADRVGRNHPPLCHLENGSRVASRPRPIVARFAFWKKKDQLVWAARESRPKDVQILEDCSNKTLEKRRELISELAAERKKGCHAYFVMDRIVFTDKPPNGDGITHGQ